MDEGEEHVVTVGDRLRAAREAAGLTIEDVATTTRIPTRHLESLETSDFTRLPAPTYTVGFAKNYAAAVGLDRDEIGDLMRTELGGTRPPVATPDLFEPADPARAMPRWLIFAAIAALILAAVVFSLLSRSAREGPDAVVADNLAFPSEEPQAATTPALAQGPVVITANEEVWIQVRDGPAIIREVTLAPGQSYEVPATASAPTLTTGKPEALRISVGTADAPAIGPAATKVSNVSLLPADLMRGPQPAAAAPPPAAAPAAERRPPSSPASRPRPAARRQSPPAVQTPPAANVQANIVQQQPPNP